jgi:hypothetical protein
VRRIFLGIGIRCARLIEDGVLVGWMFWRCHFASLHCWEAGDNDRFGLFFFLF